MQILLSALVALSVAFGGSYFFTHEQSFGAPVSVMTTQQGGTGTSSPLGILYGDQTSKLKTVTIGSNLTFSGGTLSGSAGGGSSFGQSWEVGTDIFGVTALSPTTSVPIYVKNSTATSSFRGGIESWSKIGAPYFVGTSTATSTFVGGVNLTGTDCFAVGGTCLQTYIQNATAYKAAVNYATAAVLAGTPSYSNGSSGVGATLTEVGFGALSVDGASPTLGQRILVKNEADQTTNGVYTVTTVGSGIASYLLTRATDFNTTNDIYAGVTVPVLAGGTANGDTVWTESTTGTIIVGTSNIVFIESSVGTAADIFAWPFSPTTNFNGTKANATTSPIWFQGATYSLFASSTAVFNNASTTGLTNTGTTWFTGLTNSGLGVDAVGKVYAAATTTFGTGITYNPATGGVTCDTASASVFGCLSSANWTTFNNKQAPGFQISTTTVPSFAISNLAYITGTTPTTIGGVATGTVSGTNGITVTASRAAIGGALAIDCTVSTASAAGCLATTDWTAFNNKANDPFPTHTAFYGVTTPSATSTMIHLTGAPYSLTASSTSEFDSATSTYFETKNNTFLVNGAGKVGIATTTPWGLLSIHADALGSGVPEFAIGSSTKTDFMVSGAGNVGVATTSPGTLFSINGSANFTTGTSTILGNGLLAPRFNSTATSSLAGLQLNTGGLTIATLSNSGLGVNASSVVYAAATTTFSTGVTYNPATGGVTCDTATASVFGCLTSANWTTFNNKQAPGFQISTTTVPSFAISNLTYVTGTTPTTIGGVATGTLTVTSPISIDNATRGLVGGAAVISCPTCITSGVFDLFPTHTAFYGATTPSATSTLIHFTAAPYSIAASSTSEFDSATSTYFETRNNTILANGAGLVGIASTTPWGLLSINGNGIASAAPQFAVGSSTAMDFVIAATGYTGIGTSSPWSAFTLDRLAGTGIASSSITVTEYAPATSTAGKIDCKDSNRIRWRLGAAATTLTIQRGVPGQSCTVVVENPNETAGALTWAATQQLYPAGKAAAAQTTTANANDVWSILFSQGSSTIKVLLAQSANF